MTQTAKPEKKKEGGGKAAKQGLIIVFIVVLLGINGGQLYVWYKAKEEIAQNEETIAEQKETIETKRTEIDSLITQIEQRISEKQKLEGNVAELEAALEDLQILNEKLKKDAGRAAYYYKQWKDMKEQYEPMLKRQDEEIAALKLQNKELNENVVALKEDKAELRDSISTLEHEAQNYSDTLKKAKILFADGFKVTSLKKTKSGFKEKFVPDSKGYKPKELIYAKIDYFVAKNLVANISERDIYIQVKDPGGNTLSDANGGGKFTAVDSEMFYTLKDTFTYTREKITRSIQFQNDTEYKSGQYQILVYAEEHLIGSGSFKVR